MTDETPEWKAEVFRRTVIDEGDKTTAYPDPLTGGAPWTIGLGHTGPEVHPGLVWTQAQVEAAFDADLPKYVDDARNSLSPGIFDSMTDARRFAIFDLCYNMGSGADGWGAFGATRDLINRAQAAKNANFPIEAHPLFVEAGQHLRASAWFGQVGDRAKRDVAMLVAGEWCNPTGDGGDLAA